MKKNKSKRKHEQSQKEGQEDIAEENTEKTGYDDSEQQAPSEEPPKKRKKKKKTEEPQTEGENKMSKRQMKRERHAQRLAEAEAASHKAVMMQALSYLSLWKYNKNEWKFNKVKQIWLCKHKFETDKIPDELWQPFLEYFAKASGGVKGLLIQDSNEVIKKMEKWMEDNKDTENPENKPSEFAYKRARDILQNVNEE